MMNKKRIGIISFTDKGKILEAKIAESLPEYEFLTRKEGESLQDFVPRFFDEGSPLVFVGAAGIAVRAIVPLVKDKLKDPPVIVIDEAGCHVIPLLSGHYGGANELAEEIGKAVGAVPVITTATDINQAFSADVFAREKGLEIVNREGIAKVATKAMEGKPITISIKDYPPADKVDVVVAKDFSGTLNLKGQVSGIIDSGIVAGIGCKKGKEFEEILSLLREAMDKAGLDIKELKALATIDIKMEEPGLIQLSRMLSIPLIAIDREILGKVEGEFSASDFVKETVGVDNVCERAALAVVGKGGRLLLNKQTRDGVTVALAGKETGGEEAIPGKEDGIQEIMIVGIGPGDNDSMTEEARIALHQADVIIGYKVYLDLIQEKYGHKEMMWTPMKREIERCRLCFEEAEKGKRVALVCSGDAGIYGMASVMYELMEEYRESFSLKVIPGITAATSGAAVLGAPLNHDFAVISLSDLLTPWEKIEKRLRAAAEGDFAMAIYNPSSKKRWDYLKRACDILLETLPESRPCGFVKNIGREGTERVVCTLGELRDMEVDMFTTVFIGNSQSRIIEGNLVTPRGYKVK